MDQYGDIFTEEKLSAMFPAERADDFFEALFGDSEEGSYDIGLVYTGAASKGLRFEMHLTQRPGKCLACNLTYGLPQVFSRHPIINVQGIADTAAAALGKESATWELGATREVTNKLHVIPLMITPA